MSKLIEEASLYLASQETLKAHSLPEQPPSVPGGPRATLHQAANQQ